MILRIWKVNLMWVFCKYILLLDFCFIFCLHSVCFIEEWNTFRQRTTTPRTKATPKSLYDYPTRPTPVKKVLNQMYADQGSCFLYMCVFLLFCYFYLLFIIFIID